MPYQNLKSERAKENFRKRYQKYIKSPKGIATRLKNYLAYRESEHGKKIRNNAERKYRNSPKGKKYYQEYRNSSEGKEVQLKYSRSTKGIESRRRSHMKRMYNLTVQQYDDMIKSCDGKCGACFKVAIEKLRIDHDHTCCFGKKSCGKCVRGLLCDKCNKLLGFCKDSILTLEGLIVYLKKYKREIPNE